ncbi:MAG: helix-turn-helix transcriptional regulator [Sulfurimonas sp.]|uniref:helix-turn-helix domain-containing protein n=1 Tax=Sulfurimonas sp. TaxID=2022749 RepID=UPI0026188238|nr:helix-turn-helix transcriptional regulator [Sulfurimonas sp.]MDD2651648.1 helix-turn-helix transcriptional regulator [Sulfurimonas sp.]MDD3451459.1 helix-turn-helix transcriptional regulator [Sulfurimonas sp.]
MSNEENIVKKACKELGVTQKELAETMGVSPQAVSQWHVETPKTIQLALELLIENKELRRKLEIIKKAQDIMNTL